MINDITYSKKKAESNGNGVSLPGSPPVDPGGGVGGSNVGTRVVRFEDSSSSGDSVSSFDFLMMEEPDSKISPNTRLQYRERARQHTILMDDLPNIPSTIIMTPKFKSDLNDMLERALESRSYYSESDFSDDTHGDPNVKADRNLKHTSKLAWLKRNKCCGDMQRRWCCCSLGVVSICVAAMAYISALVFVAYACFISNIYDMIGSGLLAAFYTFTGSGMIYAIIKRSAFWLGITQMAINVTGITIFTTLITRWIYWLKAYQDPNIVTTGWDIAIQVMFTLSLSIYFVSLLFVLGLTSSLKCIFEVGGTGFEKRNYVQILNWLDEEGEDEVNPVIGPYDH